mmetsp:Transcript_27697/g.72514  ORF Transcript_27697/g.72514 Transcript_27697/m.72514 type:complete len:428 (+) Transcript_27697:323-1606(+)
MPQRHDRLAVVALADAPAALVAEGQLVREDGHQEDQLFLAVPLAGPAPPPAVDRGLQLRGALLVPVVALRQRNERQGPENEVLWEVVDLRPARADGGEVRQLHRGHVHLSAVAKHREHRGLANALVPQDVPVLDELAAAQRRLAVVRDPAAVDFREHVAAAQRGADRRRDAHEQHPRDAFWDAVRGPERLVLQLVPPVGHGGRERVAALRVAAQEERTHYLCRDHVADVVGVAAGVLAEGHPGHEAARVEHGPSAAARVDRRVDLDDERGVRGRGQVYGIDAGHDALRDADGAAARREAQGLHRLLQGWQAAGQLHGLDALDECPEVVRHRGVDLDEGQVDVWAEILHLASETLGGAVGPDADVDRVGDHVRVGHDAPPGDDEAGARRGGLLGPRPGAERDPLDGHHLEQAHRPPHRGGAGQLLRGL